MQEKTLTSHISEATLSQHNLSVYEPSIFWKKALQTINNVYMEKGIKSFRSDDTNLMFFVPTYGLPGNSFTRAFVQKIESICKENYGERQIKEIEARFNGSKEAYADYRAFKIATNFVDPLKLTNFSESNIGSPKEHFCFENKWFSRSSLNYLLGLCFLFSIFPNFRPRRVLEIGGGFGTLAEILGKSNIKNFRYLNLDLSPMFLIARDYISECFAKDKMFSVTDKTPINNFCLDELETFSFFHNSQIEKLKGSIDLFVNFISFQEMEPNIVSNYIDHVQRLKPEIVLIRNLREGKQVKKEKGLGVKNPILKKDYIEMFCDYKLVKSNVLEYGLETVDGFNSELLLLKRNK